ncbi:UPF0149 family protein [Thiohalomonas denitrificans]|uniref:YecA family protein n=1 Tax=Thiohalomonas denitrificans TaxID=415747 RepID=A0A1G5R2U7_9GAMM|nr:YecA family protein [Thiohalomonas denitrificans]SCZ68327.1 hypothetical protein SAMN03097708_03288 [Thiohalomonas denitrificans]
MSDNHQAIEQLTHALEMVNRETGAVECHGLLTGLLCARPELSGQEWVEFVAAGENPEQGAAIFKALYSETVRQLENSVLDFHPLLPDEDEALEERVAALAEWVQGFLLGLAEEGMADPDRLPEDSAEIVRDFADIAAAESYEFGEGEEDESAYTELLEYVRTGVLLVNEEVNPTKAPPLGDVTLH